VDLVGGDQGESLGEGEAQDLDVLVGFRCGDAFADVAGEVDLHPFAEEAWAGEVFCEQHPAFGTVAGLFDQFAFGGSQCGFFGFNAAGGKLEEELAGGMAVLALEDDVGVVGVAGFVDSENDDGTVVANDVADVDVAARFFYGVGEDGEDFTSVGEFGGDQLGV